MTYLRAVAQVVTSLAALAFLSTDASAQTGGTGGTVPPLAAADFAYFVQSYVDGQWVQLNETDKNFHFNRARCECIADPNQTGLIRLMIRPSAAGSQKIRDLLAANVVGTGFARLYAGTDSLNCLNPSAAAPSALRERCVNLIDPANYEANIEGGMSAIAATNEWPSPPIPVAWLFNATKSPVCSGAGCDSTDNCATTNATATIYFWAQTSSQSKPDLDDSVLTINLVGKSSFVPTNVRAEGGQGALTVRWDWPSNVAGASTSLLGVQILCSQGDEPLPIDLKKGNQYMTQATLCGGTASDPPTGFAALDPKYVCSDLVATGTNEFRVKGLTNGVTYTVAVAAIDKYKNATISTQTAEGTPLATVDFYSQYKSDGGQAEGGYCAVAGGRGTPGLLLAGILAALALVGWRRRRGRRGPGAGAPTILLAALLSSGQAQAQPAYGASSDVGRDTSLAASGEPVWRGTPQSFAIEARFGMYTPAVDSEFGGTATPHAAVFGSQERPMWQLEFDWQFFRRFGSLAVGGVVGYFKENAHACKQGTLQGTTCERSGDNTSLRLIPFAALLVYRFDVLAEEWGIPIVPYGKLGLNYTFWSVSDGNGETPEVGTPEVGTSKGSGGTAGWQAAIGVSLRLDFFDPAAARGFDADAGVNHSYAFFELTSIESSGLGQSKALRVGDKTWFAGLMFEF